MIMPKNLKQGQVGMNFFWCRVGESKGNHFLKKFDKAAKGGLKPSDPRHCALRDFTKEKQI